MTTRDDGLASVRKALALLDVVARDSRGATAKDISAALGIPLPSVYRLLQTLVASEHVVHLREQRRYGLGYKVHALDTSLRRQVGTPAAVRRRRPGTPRRARTRPGRPRCGTSRTRGCPARCGWPP